MTQAQLADWLDRSDAGTLTEAERAELERWLRDDCPHPAGLDLLYWPDQAGLPLLSDGATIAREVFEWVPRQLEMTVSAVRRAPAWKDRCAVTFAAPGVRCWTQVAAPLDHRYRQGDVYIVALHGYQLPTGERVWRHFENGVAVNALVLGRAHSRPSPAPDGESPPHSY